jgi:D-arginine dehydrogenase
MPLLRAAYVAGAVLDDSATDIDVHALHQGYLAMLRRHGGALRCGARVETIERCSDGWRLISSAGTFTAPLLVNAAGAWADEIAARAGVGRIGLEPLRRSAALVDLPDAAGSARWPMTLDIDGDFYFKPDAGRLLISPADETPCAPGDVVPEELDLATAVDRIERATTLDIRRLHSRWAGLRSFVRDRAPVAGFDAVAPGFFWLAGQGGTGIQTAPALSRFAAAQVLGRPLPPELAEIGLDAGQLSPARLTRS